MNNLDKLRDEKVKAYSKIHEEKFDYQSGWNAHEALNLPALFAEWKDRNCTQIPKRALFTIKEVEGYHHNLSLYQYWVNFIYKPE